jgi:phosphoglycerate dehydrogenase-like enzyme
MWCAVNFAATGQKGAWRLARTWRLYGRASLPARNASLDAEACTARGIPVCKTAGGAGTEAAPAELALGLLLAAARAIPAADANMRAGRFQEGVPVGISLAGKTIGIIGLGRLGSFMAGYCRALNMTVLAWSENLTAEKALAAGATLVRKMSFCRGLMQSASTWCYRRARAG